MVLGTPHLQYGADMGGYNGSLGLGMETAAMTPQDSGALKQPKQFQDQQKAEPDKGYDFGDVLLNFVFRGYPAALERLDLQKKDRKLAQELRMLETQRQQGVSYLNRAYEASQAGKLEDAANYLGKTYESFPDGVEYGGIRSPRPDEEGNPFVHFKDKGTGEMKAAFPLTKENIDYALKEANAGLQDKSYMKGRIARLGEIKLTNAKLIKQAQILEDGSVAWQHMTRDGDIVQKTGSKEEFEKVGGRYVDAQRMADKMKMDIEIEEIGLEKAQLGVKEQKGRIKQQDQTYGLGGLKKQYWTAKTSAAKLGLENAKSGTPGKPKVSFKEKQAALKAAQNYMKEMERDIVTDRLIDPDTGKPLSERQKKQLFNELVDTFTAYYTGEQPEQNQPQMPSEGQEVVVDGKKYRVSKKPGAQQPTQSVPTAMGKIPPQPQGKPPQPSERSLLSRFLRTDEQKEELKEMAEGIMERGVKPTHEGVNWLRDKMRKLFGTDKTSQN